MAKLDRAEPGGVVTDRRYRYGDPKSPSRSCLAWYSLAPTWRANTPDETPSVSVNRELVTEIVAAYVRRNQVASDQLATLISTVHQAISGLGKPVAETETERTPAVAIRRSVHRDYVVCLECGWRGLTLKRHLTSRHGFSIDQYSARWNLSREHPMTAPSYSERRSAFAKQFGLGRGRKISREEPESTAPEDPPAPQQRSRRRGGSRSRPVSA